MAKTAFAILLVMVWVTVAAAAAAALNNDKKPGHQFFTSLPEYVQEDYLTFELSRGLEIHERSLAETLGRNLETELFPDGLDIPEDLVQQFQALETPDNFTENLYNFVQSDFNVDRIGIRALITDRYICFENGECININDIGAICCPF